MNISNLLKSLFRYKKMFNLKNFIKPKKLGFDQNTKEDQFSQKYFYKSTTEIPSVISLFTNFSWLTIGNTIYSGCQWGLIIILAKMFSAEIVGSFSFALAITAPVFMFFNLNLRAAQSVDANYKYSFVDYLGLRIITTVIALLCIIGIALFAGFKYEIMMLILLLGLAKSFESISDLFYGLLQQHESMNYIAKSMIIKGLLSLVAMSILVFLTGSINIGVLGLTIAWALILFSYDMRNGMLILHNINYRVNNIFWNKQRIIYLLKSVLNIKDKKKLFFDTLPLGFITVFASLNVSIPRYLIMYFYGEKELGIFTAIYYLPLMIGMIINPMASAATPRFAKYYVQQNKEDFIKLLLKLEVVSVIICGIALLVFKIAGQEILNLFYMSEYARQSDVLIWLMIAGFITYSGALFSVALTSMRKFKIQMYTQIVNIIILSVLSFYLIQMHESKGAAFAILICAVFLNTVYILSFIRFFWTRNNINSNISIQGGGDADNE